MSPFSCLCPPFPSLFSHSPKPPLTHTDHSGTPNCHRPAPPSHGTDAPDQDVNESTSYPSTPGNPIYPQSHFRNPQAVDRVLDSLLGGQSAQPSRPATPIGVVPSNPVQQHGHISEQPTHPEPPSNQTDPSHAHQLLVPQNIPYPLTTSSHESLGSQRPSVHQNQGMFNQASYVSPMGNFIYGSVGSVIYSNGGSKNFMRELLKETIHGAASDSSARDPPPKCHPGTRLLIFDRCLHFIENCEGVKKIRWVVGAPGVGKSAIMQEVVDSPRLKVTYHASVFFSTYGRNDGTKTIMTLSYQFAAKSEVYRRLIEDVIDRDPSLLQSVMAVQFNKLIVEPFIHHPQLNTAGRILIIIDGLDECNNPGTEEQLLFLIFNLCITYPSSPIVWLIACRPEQHIISFFSQDVVMPVYETEKILVDSDESCADVRKFLKEKLEWIQKSFNLHSKWPGRENLKKLTDASGGLFAYADTAVKYIGDLSIRHPAAQLSVVLEVIDSHPIIDVPPDKHPMARLDALYSQILSKVSPQVKRSNRNLLLALASDWDWALYSGTSSFIFLCNWLGMTAEDAYAVINPLCSVFHVPRREEAHKEEPRPFHKSIVDYLSDFNRSRFSHDIKNEAQKYRVQCAFRISKQAPDGVDFGDVDYKFHYGNLARGPGTGGNISLTWPADEGLQNFDSMLPPPILSPATSPPAHPLVPQPPTQSSCLPIDDSELRLMVYKTAIGQVVSGIERREQAFQNQFCIRLLITRFQSYGSVFPYDCLRDLVFDKQRRDEFMTCGILKPVPLKFIDSSNEVIKVKFRFRRLTNMTVLDLANPWNPSCDDLHEQDREPEEEMDEDWTTNLWRDCRFCFKRLEDQLEKRKALSPDHVVSILFTSTGSCCVEFHFVDPEDGISEWTYWFWVSLTLEERKKYGSNV